MIPEEPAAKAPSPRPRNWWIPASVLLVLVGSAALHLGAGEEDAATPRGGINIPFERQKWREEDPEDGLREEMLDDLFRHHLKPGMTRREVESLLGTPGPGDKYTCLPGLPEGAVDSLCFTVSRGMDPCTLLLGFDSAGRFVRAIKDCS